MTIQLSTLSNGLTIVTDYFDSVETVALGLWVSVGSRHETKEINGISHMLEHMAFRGTATQTAQEIAEKIEAVGGHLNAYTSRESTAYYARILHNKPLALSILADILQFSVFREEELERERAVILQEISQVQDAPDDLTFDCFQETAYSDQPFGRPITGRADVVSKLSREQIKTYMTKNYSAKNMIFAAAGKVDHQQLVSMMENQFSLLASETTRSGEPARYTGGYFTLQKNLEQVHLVLGFQGIDLNSPDYYTASMLATILGGGMSSRLFQEIREKRGLAYGVHSFSSSALDTGTFGIYTSAGPKEAQDLLPVVCDELLKVSSTLTEKEISRSRNQLKASLLMALESTSSRCRQLAFQMMVYGRPLDSSEIIDRIDAVEEQDIAKLATRIFSGTPTLTAVGPVQHLMSYEKLCQRLGVKAAA
ncbi:protease 3 precursor [Caedimonas varicaedens]|uniref:Protease 3 n=1 Tax=Caedimonas varicaedens TaxID=1629334 RepID=A0A0K8MBW2_9PROT|nr:protease 3 precursor [Caedimonas varicaedens]